VSDILVSVACAFSIGSYPRWMGGQDNGQVDHEGEEEGRVEVDREAVDLVEASGQALLAHQVWMVHPIDNLAAECQEARRRSDDRSVDLGQWTCTCQIDAQNVLIQVLAMAHTLTLIVPVRQDQEKMRPSSEEGLLW